NVRRFVRRGPRRRGGAARAAAGGTDLLGPQPRGDDRSPGGAAAGPVARPADRRRARTDGRGDPRATDAPVLGTRGRRAGLHDDHRVGPRRAQRQYAGGGSSGPARPRAALSAAWAGGALLGACVRVLL